VSGSQTPRTDAERLERLLLQEASLREVIETISSDLDLQSLLTRIVQSACHLLEADNGTISLADEVQDVVRVAAAFRMPEDEIGSQAKPGQGLSGKVLESGRPVIFNRYGDVSDPTRTDLTDNAVIGVPIFWRDRVIGVFGLGSEPPRKFYEEDVEVLSRFAKHAAIAIDNARLFDHAQSALGEMQLLYETSARLGVALHPDEIVSAYLDQVAARGKYACTIIEYEFDESNNRTGVFVKGRWDKEEGTVVGNWWFPHERDALDDLLDRGETVVISNVETDDRVTEYLKEMQRQDGHPALAMIPLLTAGQRTGLVILTSKTVQEWADRELRPYQATAGYLAIALRHRHEQLSLMEAERQVAVLRDRQRLAHELHDSVTQLLTGINFIAQATPNVIKRDPVEGEKRLDQLATLSRRALSEMRALLAELAPREHRAAPEPHESGEGLVEMIRAHLASMQTAGPIVTVEASKYQSQSPVIEHALYRIAQEAVNNALKYAGATQIVVELAVTSSAVVLTVVDDGIGLSGSLPARNHPDSSGLGIPGMRRRASELGGSIRVHGPAGQGTVVEIRLPLGR
jgi:signal transduction histidine kinase